MAPASGAAPPAPTPARGTVARYTIPDNTEVRVVPTYSYRCRRCAARFELFLPVSRRDEAVCPRCGGAGADLEAVPAWQGAVVSAPARTGCGDDAACGADACPACPGAEGCCSLD